MRAKNLREVYLHAAVEHIKTPSRPIGTNSANTSQNRQPLWITFTDKPRQSRARGAPSTARRQSNHIARVNHRSSLSTLRCRYTKTLVPSRDRSTKERTCSATQIVRYKQKISPLLDRIHLFIPVSPVEHTQPLKQSTMENARMPKEWRSKRASFNENTLAIQAKTKMLF